jgi:hypothetical protein
MATAYMVYTLRPYMPRYGVLIQTEKRFGQRGVIELTRRSCERGQ